MQYCACMNPTAGSFSITPRMQRHFATFAVQMPSVDIMRCYTPAALHSVPIHSRYTYVAMQSRRICKRALAV